MERQIDCVAREEEPIEGYRGHREMAANLMVLFLRLLHVCSELNQLTSLTRHKEKLVNWSADSDTIPS